MTSLEISRNFVNYFKNYFSNITLTPQITPSFPYELNDIQSAHFHNPKRQMYSQSQHFSQAPATEHSTNYAKKKKKRKLMNYVNSPRELFYIWLALR